MDRQNRQLTVLSVILLVIVAFVVLDWDRADRDRPADADAPPSHDLFPYTSDVITKLTLTRPDGVVEFEKKEGAWAMTKPVAVAAEDQKVDTIVDRFESIRIDEAELTGPIADYGLDEAQRIEVRLERADATAFTVYVGKDTPVGYKSYGQVPGDPAVHVLDSQVASLVTKSADEFRDRDVLSFAAGGARRVRIQAAGVETVLRKDDTGWWIGDTGPRADGKKVSDWLSAITLMKVAKFLDGETPESAGLTTPEATVAIEDEGGTHTLRIGKLDAEGAAATSGDLPIRIGMEDVAKLLAQQSWPSALLVEVQSWKVDSVSLTLGEKKLDVSRKDGAWKNAAGEEAKGVDDIVASLLELPVDRTGAPTMSGTYGKVDLGIGGGKHVVVNIGDTLPEGARVAREEAGGPAFSVPAGSLALLQDALDGKAKVRLPESPEGGDGMPPGFDIDELMKQAGQGR